MTNYIDDIKAMLPAEPTREQIREACLAYFEFGDPAKPLMPLAAYLQLVGEVN